MEMLSTKFNSLITQYQDTYQDFLNAVNSNNNTLTSVSNYAFVGQSNLNTIQGSSANDCLSSCTSTNSCSGATYDMSSNNCTLSTGNGSMVSSTNQIAIVKQALYYSNQLKQLNDELTNVNNTMMQNVNANMNSYSQTQQATNNKAEILNNNYKTLEDERSQIEELIRQYETIHSAYENGNINATSNYYSYVMYLLVVIGLVFLLLKTSVSGNQVGGGHHMKVSPILLIFLGIVIIFNASLKN